MAVKSLSTGDTGLVTPEIQIEGATLPGSYPVKSIYILKGVNKISIARIQFLDGGVTSADDFKLSNDSDNFAPGKLIEIKLGYDSKTTTVFKGIIIKHGLKINPNGSSFLNIECRDLAIKLTVGRKNAIFEEKTDSDIITDVLKNYTIEKEIEATSNKHPEIVQHYVSDWDFILMRADLNGQIVVPDDGKLIIKKPKLTGDAELEVVYGKGMISFNGDLDARNQYKKVTGYSWNSGDQQVISSSGKVSEEPEQGSSLSTSKLSEVVGLSDYLLQTGANVPTSVLEAWASAKLLKSKASKVQGKVKFIGYPNLKPGDLIQLGGLSEYFNGKAFVGAIEHIVDDGVWTTEVHMGLSPSTFIEETPDVASPMSSGIIPPIQGLITGKVTQIHEDKEGQFRVKVSIPTLQNDNMGVWARIAKFYATKESGLFFMPEIGDEVILGFINDDPQNAVILGSLYSQNMAPPLTPEEGNNLKGLVTRSKLKITFDDENKIITILTPAENTIVLDDKEGQIKIADKNKNVVLLSADGISLTSEKDIVLKAKGNIKMEAQQNIESKATQDVKTEGTNVEAKGKAKFAAEGAMAELKGSAQTVIKGGMVMIN